MQGGAPGCQQQQQQQQQQQESSRRLWQHCCIASSTLTPPTPPHNAPPPPHHPPAPSAAGCDLRSLGASIAVSEDGSTLAVAAHHASVALYSTGDATGGSPSDPVVYKLGTTEAAAGGEAELCTIWSMDFLQPTAADGASGTAQLAVLSRRWAALPPPRCPVSAGTWCWSCALGLNAVWRDALCRHGWAAAGLRLLGRWAAGPLGCWAAGLLGC
jgi:hypothetical protein